MIFTWVVGPMSYVEYCTDQQLDVSNPNLILTLMMMT